MIAFDFFLNLKIDKDSTIVAAKKIFQTKNMSINCHG